MSQLFEPVRIRTYRRLLIAYATNALGTWAGQIALSILVLARTHSPAATAAVMVAGQFIPSLLAPLLVARVEPLGARRTLPAFLIGEAALFLALAELSKTGSLTAILAVVGLDGILGLAAKALLKASMVATTRPRGLLREGNSLLIMVFTTCMAVGPVAAGLMITLLSPRAGLLLDAGSFALAALALLGQIEHASCQQHSQEQSALRQSLSYVAGQPQLRRLLHSYALLSLAGAAILPIEIVLVTRTLHATPACYGIVLALWGIGATLGSALVTRLRHLPLTLLVAGSFLIMGTSYLGMGGAPTVLVVAGFSFLGGIGNGIESFATLTAIQEQTTDTFQMRVSGLVESLTAATTGLGFIAGGLIATLVSPRAVYLLAGLAILACTGTLLIPHTTTPPATT